MDEQKFSIVFQPIRPFTFCDRLKIIILGMEIEILGIKLEINDLKEKLHDA